VNKLTVQFKQGYLFWMLVDDMDAKIIMKMIYDQCPCIMLEGRAVFNAEDVLYVFAERLEAA
jgi:hypothetical protein